MLMTFKTVALITSIVALGLGLAYFIAGDLVVGRWQLLASDGVLLMGRRLGALYLGLAAIFFFARATPLSETRLALALGTAMALAFLALVGVYELIAGHLGTGILASVAVETLLSLSFLRLYITDRRLLK
jgi:hypothetical protein